MPTHFISGLLHQATAQGSRSTVLRPLGWLLAILFAATIGAIEVGARNWVLVAFVILTVLSCLLYMGAYIFCLIRNPETLRSETYSIQKLAIEKGFGDSVIGMQQGTVLPLVQSIIAKPVLKDIGESE